MYGAVLYSCAGLNAGIMLMNVTRMREASWVPRISQLFKKHSKQLNKGDQDVVNLFFHSHPGMFKISAHFSDKKFRTKKLLYHCWSSLV